MPEGQPSGVKHVRGFDVVKPFSVGMMVLVMLPLILLPLLSIFISFGIQGVMLIVAWLIGESFAVGMNQRASDGRRMRLVDASVSDYQRRGFKSLMVSFGCTGGRHRSVYLAEQLGKHLREKQGLDVVVRHLALENTGE